MASEGTFDPSQLEQFKKKELIELIKQLQKEKNELINNQLDIKNVTARVIKLERSQYLYEQYGRRESVEISGIPENIEQNNLEAEVIKIYNEAKVKVHDRELKKKDITACHRIGRKGVTIVRFVNRKHAYEGLRLGKNLKNSKLYDNQIYINNSFCREFSKLGFIIRRLKQNSMIMGYKVKHGVYQIQTETAGVFEEISHISDFEKHGLSISQFL